MRRFLRFTVLLIAAMAALRFAPGLAATWQSRLSLPLLQWMHRATAALPFPLLEPLALLMALACGRRRTRAAALAVAVGMAGLLWYPAYFAAPTPQNASSGAEEALCLRLVDALNASDLAFESPFGTAGAAAGMPWAEVKPARYPEWMRALGVTGLFSPWTGEALVDGDAPPGYLPFTCVHELMHLRGIADEGAANAAAYEACVDFGGMYADSARLWALRYAMARLDPPARERVVRRMDDRLRALSVCDAPRPSSPLARLLGIGEQTRDYGALVDRIAVDFGPGKE